MKKNALVFAAALLAASSLVAQPAKKGKGNDPTPVNATLDQINDRRTTGSFSQLMLAVKLDGTRESDVVAARIAIRKAVDDTGRDLVDTESGEPRFEATAGAYDKESKDPVTIRLSLTNPTRDAVAIKEVRGEVELYMPSKDKDAVVVVPKFQSVAGKPIANKTLKANGIEISVMGKAQLEAERAAATKKYAAEMKEAGYDEETLKSLVESFEQTYTMPGDDAVWLKVKDPNMRIHELAFVDGAGEAQRAYTSGREGGITEMSTYGAVPDASWGLQISLRTPKTMARHSFALSDIPLP